MKIYKKITSLIFSLCAALAMITAGVFGAGAVGVSPIAANEGKITLWIFAGLIVAAAAAGIIYFVIQHKNKK